MSACQISCQSINIGARPGPAYWHCRYWDEICVRSRKGRAREGVILGPSSESCRRIPVWVEEVHSQAHPPPSLCVNSSSACLIPLKIWMKSRNHSAVKGRRDRDGRSVWRVRPRMRRWAAVAAVTSRFYPLFPSFCYAKIAEILGTHDQLFWPRLFSLLSTEKINIYRSRGKKTCKGVSTWNLRAS